MERKILDYCTGVQHIGIPAEDMEKTCIFYEKLGFERVFHTIIRESQHVSFFKFQNLMLEVYEESRTAKAEGAINHFVIDCEDIEAAYEMVKKQGYVIVSEEIESLPFWKNGVRFFIIEGPNHERIEVNQKL